jgi:hypothetical protein
VAWGDNSAGQTNVPANLTNVVAIAAGGYHNLALIGNAAHGMRFTGVSCGQGGQIQLNVSGYAGDVYRVLASTNLSDWTSIATVTNIGGAVQFNDTAMTNYSRRFYRLVMP